MKRFRKRAQTIGIVNTVGARACEPSAVWWLTCVEVDDCCVTNVKIFHEIPSLQPIETFPFIIFASAFMNYQLWMRTQNRLCSLATLRSHHIATEYATTPDIAISCVCVNVVWAINQCEIFITFVQLPQTIFLAVAAIVRQEPKKKIDEVVVCHVISPVIVSLSLFQ